MNWLELKEQIESMKPEQQKMEVVVVNDFYDEILNIDNAIWWNMRGHNHTGESPTPNLEHSQPYLTTI
jgi:hypothetical protein